MPEEITLQTLIDKIKADLFSPYTSGETRRKVVYPVFLVDELELELVVNITHSVRGGIKVTVPQITEGSLGAGHEAGRTHTIKIKLTPILTRDELRNQMQADERLWRGVVEATEMAVRRGSKLAGEEE